MSLFRLSKPLVILSLAALLMGCESAFDTRPITEKYARQLESVSLGMSRAELRQVLPKVQIRGQNMVNGKQVDAYVLLWFHTERMQGDRVTEELWFYFHSDKLVRWGGPNDWPTAQELDVTIRHR